MPRITHVKKAQKDQGNCRRCGKPIKTGDSYKWFANLIGRTSIRKNFCIACTPRPSDLTTSDKLAQLYSVQETLEEAIAVVGCAEMLADALREAEGEAREVSEAYRESISNMPENLQQSSQCDEMNEKADNIDSWADDLSSAADEIEGLDAEPSDEDECTGCSHPYSDHHGPDHACVNVTDGATCTCEEFETDVLTQAVDIADGACSGLSI